MCASPRLLQPLATGEGYACEPSTRAAELVRHLDGVRPQASDKLYDVAVIGAGPAGLTTAVRAASDGLRVVVVDAHELGGKLRGNPRIENPLGFPAVISGSAWMSRAVAHAQRFGVEAMASAEVTGVLQDGSALLLQASAGQVIRARSVVVATGVHPRRPRLAGLDAFEGRGLWYWASRMQARRCAGEEVVVLADCESGGETALLLARFASKVWLLVRGLGLEPAVSKYWAERISAVRNIELRTQTELVALGAGNRGGLASLRWRSAATGGEEERPIRNMFVFEGTDPGTSWLRDSGVVLDARGFVRTGSGERDLGAQPLQSSVRGLFAVGDVRAGSVKRVDAALSEGVAVAAQLRGFLAR